MNGQKKADGNVFTVGLSAYAVEQLGDIVYMELPEAGAEFAAGDAFGVVESVKIASDMYMPIGGKVVEVNESVSGWTGCTEDRCLRRWLAD